MQKYIELENKLIVINLEINEILNALKNHTNKTDNIYLDLSKNLTFLIKKRTKLLNEYNKEMKEYNNIKTII